MTIEIVEPEDGSQVAVNGKFFIFCDCDYTDPCPQGKTMGSSRCIVRIDAKKLSSEERKRLESPQR